MYVLLEVWAQALRLQRKGTAPIVSLEIHCGGGDIKSTIDSPHLLWTATWTGRCLLAREEIWWWAVLVCR